MKFARQVGSSARSFVEVVSTNPSPQGDVV